MVDIFADLLILCNINLKYVYKLCLFWKKQLNL